MAAPISPVGDPGPDAGYRGIEGRAGCVQKERVVAQVNSCCGIRNVPVDLYAKIELDNVAFRKDPLVPCGCGIVGRVLV